MFSDSYPSLFLLKWLEHASFNLLAILKILCRGKYETLWTGGRKWLIDFNAGKTGAVNVKKDGWKNHLLRCYS